MSALVDLEVLEADPGGGIMEQLYSTLEGARIELLESPLESESAIVLDDMERSLTLVDRRLQDLEEEGGEIAEHVVKLSRGFLALWNQIIGKDPDLKLKSAFSFSLVNLLRTIDAAAPSEQVEDVEDHFAEIKHIEQRLRAESVDNRVMIGKVKDVFLESSEEMDFAAVAKLLYQDRSTDFSTLVNADELSRTTRDRLLHRTALEILRREFIVTLEMDFPEEEPDATEVFELLWRITTALKSIRGVSVTIDTWSDGSKKVKLKAMMDNALANEEIQDVVRTGVESAKALVAQKKTESEKTQSETREKEASARLLDRKADATPHEVDARARYRAETRRVRAEAERIELENVLLRIEIVKQAKEMVAQAVADYKGDFVLTLQDRPLMVKHGEEISLLPSQHELPEATGNGSRSGAE